jgi:hypothetical protein
MGHSQVERGSHWTESKVVSTQRKRYFGTYRGQVEIYARRVRVALVPLHSFPNRYAHYSDTRCPQKGNRARKSLENCRAIHLLSRYPHSGRAARTFEVISSGYGKRRSGDCGVIWRAQRRRSKAQKKRPLKPSSGCGPQKSSTN